MTGFAKNAIGLMLALGLPGVCFAVTPAVEGKAAVQPAVGSAPAPGYRPDKESSSLAEPAPDPAAAASYAGGGDRLQRTGIRPFSAFAIAVKVGTGGVGFDVATPLGPKLNLRGGGSFFSYSPNLTEDGIDVNGQVNFKTVDMHVDFFPFGGSFA